MGRVALLVICVLTVGFPPSTLPRATLADFDYVVSGQVVDVVDRITRAVVCQITAPVPIASVVVMPADLLLVGVAPRSTFDIPEDAVLRSARVDSIAPV